MPTQNLGFEDLPAIGRVTISSPAVLRPVERLNGGKQYGDQIKPLNFLLTRHVKQLGHPIGVDAEHFHLIAPYESDPRKWIKSVSASPSHRGLVYTIARRKTQSGNSG